MTAEPRSGVRVASAMVHIAVSVDGLSVPQSLAHCHEGFRYEAFGSPIVWCERIPAYYAAW
jgi:hypothetical protein